MVRLNFQVKLKHWGLMSVSLITLFGIQAPVTSKTINVEASSLSIITKLTGKAELLKDKKWISLKQRAIVKINDHLKTGKKSRIELTFSDGSRLRMNENTDIILKETKKGAGGNLLKVIIGELWANIVNKGKGRFAVESSTAIVAVMGTTFDVDSEKVKTDVSVFNGSVGIQLPSVSSDELNKKLDNLELKTDDNRKQDTTSGVHEVASPVQQVENPAKVIPGPYQVSQESWLEIVESQKISIDQKGIGVVSDLDQKVNDDEWVQWNKELDSNTAENLIFN